MRSSPSNISKGASSSPKAAPQDCWILTDGKIGTEKQCIALAEALGLAWRPLRLSTRFPWKYLPPALWGGARYSVTDKDGMWTQAWKTPDILPDVIISATRIAAAPAAALRRYTHTHLTRPPFFIHLLNPFLSTRQYDVVVAPYHDHLKGENVLEMQGALTNITPEFLNTVRAQKNPLLARLPEPRIALLVGGNSKYYTLTEERVHDICAQLRELHQTTGCSFMATLSRRTPAALARVFAEALAPLPHVLWDGTPPNPYNDYLAWADALLVTEDSISMVAEASATGKPVYILQMEGKAPKFAPYFEALYERGLIRRFEGEVTLWSPSPLLEAQRIAGLIQPCLLNRHSRNSPISLPS